MIEGTTVVDFSKIGKPFFSPLYVVLQSSNIKELCTEFAREMDFCLNEAAHEDEQGDLKRTYKSPKSLHQPIQVCAIN